MKAEQYFNKTIEGFKLYFICKTVRCSGGFSHVSDLYIDDKKIASARVHYMNRTWEEFSYKTAMIRAIDNGMKKDDYWSILDSYRKLINRANY